MSVQVASAIKAKLLEVIDEMNRAAEAGIRIDFAVQTEPDGTSRLAMFRAWQAVKLEQ